MKTDRKVYTKEELKDASILALSFVGDAVHTLFVRGGVFGESPYKNNVLHELASLECRASTQSEKANRLYDMLSEEEKFIFKKGKNAKVNSIPKNADLVEYKNATAFEAVIGYLYLSGQDERLKDLLRALY